MQAMHVCRERMETAVSSFPFYCVPNAAKKLKSLKKLSEVQFKMIRNVIDISAQTLGFYDLTLEGNAIGENSDPN